MIDPQFYRTVSVCVECGSVFLAPHKVGCGIGMDFAHREAAADIRNAPVPIDPLGGAVMGAWNDHMQDVRKLITAQPKDVLDVGQHFDDGKPPVDLVETGFIRGIANILLFGMTKRGYARNNWKKGIRYGGLLASALRHLFSWWDGENLDPQSGLPHLHHAACNIMFLDWYQSRKMSQDLDDRDKPV